MQTTDAAVIEPSIKVGDAAQISTSLTASKPESGAGNVMLINTYTDTSTKPNLFLSVDGKNFTKLAMPSTKMKLMMWDYSTLYYNGYYYIAYDYKDENFNDFSSLSQSISRGGNRIGILKTKDFLSFDNYYISIPEKYKQTWAPELFVDTDNKVYMAISLSDGIETTTDCAGVVTYKKYCYLMMASKDGTDLSSFSDPKLISLTDKAGTDVTNKIDPFIYYKDGYYYLFIKQEDNDYIQEYRSNRLNDGYELYYSFSGRVEEGPAVVKYNDTYFLYVDAYGKSSGKCTKYYTSRDFETWSKEEVVIIENNQRIRHCTPIVIEAAEEKVIKKNLLGIVA